MGGGRHVWVVRVCVCSVATDATVGWILGDVVSIIIRMRYY